MVGQMWKVITSLHKCYVKMNQALQRSRVVVIGSLPLQVSLGIQTYEHLRFGFPKSIL